MPWLPSSLKRLFAAFPRLPSLPWSRHGLRWGVLALCSLGLAVMGPFGTFGSLSLQQRILYWGGLVAVGTVLFEVGIRLCARQLLRGAQSALRLHFMLGGSVSVLMTAVVVVVDTSLQRHDWWGDSGSVVELFAYVLVITVLVSSPVLWLVHQDLRQLWEPPETPSWDQEETSIPSDIEEESEQRDQKSISAPPLLSSPPQAVPSFLDRLPPHLGRELLALEMEDHYVRAHTAGGSTLILMRLRDAIAELHSVPGQQIHRSYWVALAAVTAIERGTNSRLWLHLRNGQKIPVSRTFIGTVRDLALQHGWSEYSASPADR